MGKCLMKIKQMIKELGGNRAAIAEASGTSVAHINNMVSKGVEVEKLEDGRYVSVRNNAIFFKNPDVKD